jgi:eukaryotic translation initiation factor 2C
MGGPAKNRLQKEKQSAGSSNESSQGPTNRSVPRFDGNRDPTLGFRREGESAVEYSKESDLKNISEFLGLGGWYAARGVSLPQSLPQRPKQFNQYGKETTVMLNTFNVIKAPTTIAHQYDVSSTFPPPYPPIILPIVSNMSKVVYSGDAKDYTKRVLLRKIWNSKKVKAELGEPKHLWIWDGNKLAW